MANLHQAFIDFNEKIKLTEFKKADIRRRRDVVRDKIRTFFKDELKQKIVERMENRIEKLKELLGK